MEKPSHPQQESIMSDLGSKLKAFRTQQAAALKQPPYCIFTNAELEAVIAASPRSTSELSRIKGFGPSKLSKFGEAIVRLCSGHGPAATSSASRLSLGGTPAGTVSTTAPSNKQRLSLGAELSAMTLSELRQYAIDRKVAAAAVDGALDADNPKAALVLLLQSGGGGGGGGASGPASQDSGLGDLLRAYRKEQAALLDQPSYCIFTNAELEAVVAACPRSTSEIAAIRGFGPSKLSKFGDDIVRLCSGHSPAATSSASSGVKRVLPSGSGGSAASAPRPRATPAALPPLPPATRIPRSDLNAEQDAASW